MIAVPRLGVGASAGPGALVGEEGEEGHFAFDERWLRKMAPSGSSNLSMIQVSGDSMAPTLVDGDDILVDRGDAAERLRDGIYVLRREENLSVKRLALNPAGRRVSIKSDNTAYRDFSDVRLDSVDVIGRVVWAGRRVA